MKNPYIPGHLWPKEVKDAWNDMPLHDGFIAPYDEKHRGVWREWAKRHPRRLWNPNMVAAYAELDRVKKFALDVSERIPQ